MTRNPNNYPGCAVTFCGVIFFFLVILGVIKLLEIFGLI
jgi:hypothetical protein